jgi:hypothetical protein
LPDRLFISAFSGGAAVGGCAIEVTNINASEPFKKNNSQFTLLLIGTFAELAYAISALLGARGSVTETFNIKV